MQPYFRRRHVQILALLLSLIVLCTPAPMSRVIAQPPNPNYGCLDVSDVDVAGRYDLTTGTFLSQPSKVIVLSDTRFYSPPDGRYISDINRETKNDRDPISLVIKTRSGKTQQIVQLPDSNYSTDISWTYW